MRLVRLAHVLSEFKTKNAFLALTHGLEVFLVADASKVEVKE